MQTDWNAIRHWRENDGKNLQTGEVFPYYVWAQDTPTGLKFGVGGNGVEEGLFDTHAQAYARAKELRLALDATKGAGK